MKFVGDLARADVDVLTCQAILATKVLEFGAGGSTQILAQAIDPAAELVSVETAIEWIDRTRYVIRRLGIMRHIEFMLYDRWKLEYDLLPADFDLVFVDGVDEHRLAFGLESWKKLATGGRMLIHDTRRDRDLSNVVKIIRAVTPEIESVVFNAHESNTTVITKRSPLEYVNWNIVEGKEPWQYGAAPPPDSFFMD